MAANNLAAALYAEEIIEEEELVLLMDKDENKAPVYPYWSYDRFVLDDLLEDECLSEFRFSKDHIPRLAHVLRLPDDIICSNGTKATQLEALCMLLRRFAYPCRYSDMIPRFGRSVSEICLIVNQTMRHLDTNHRHLLTSLDQPWLSRDMLESYARAVYNKSQALDNCWGFIDGTVRPIYRPGENQRVVYNGHKRVHALKYQSVVAANGMIANLYGPAEGKIHDAGLLRRSGLLGAMEAHCNRLDGTPLCIYGDPAYPHRPHLQTAFRGNNLTADQQIFNSCMSRVRVSVEWVFGEIIEYFAFTDFKKSQKIGLSELGTMYVTCALLRNALTCLHGSSTSTFMEVMPPTLENYFQ